MKTREEAIAAAQEAADSRGRSMFVYPLGEGYAYGSRSWVDGMDRPPEELIEMEPTHLTKEMAISIAQTRANRDKVTMVVRKMPGGDSYIFHKREGGLPFGKDPVLIAPTDVLRDEYIRMAQNVANSTGQLMSVYKDGKGNWRMISGDVEDAILIAPITRTVTACREHVLAQAQARANATGQTIAMIDWGGDLIFGEWSDHMEDTPELYTKIAPSK